MRALFQNLLAHDWTLIPAHCFVIPLQACDSSFSDIGKAAKRPVMILRNAILLFTAMGWIFIPACCFDVP